MHSKSNAQSVAAIVDMWNMAHTIKPTNFSSVVHIDVLEKVMKTELNWARMDIPRCNSVMDIIHKYCQDPHATTFSSSPDMVYFLDYWRGLEKLLNTTKVRKSGDPDHEAGDIISGLRFLRDQISECFLNSDTFPVGELRSLLRTMRANFPCRFWEFLIEDTSFGGDDTSFMIREEVADLMISWIEASLSFCGIGMKSGSFLIPRLEMKPRRCSHRDERDSSNTRSTSTSESGEENTHFNVERYVDPLSQRSIHRHKTVPIQSHRPHRYSASARSSWSSRRYTNTPARSRHTSDDFDILAASPRITSRRVERRWDNTEKLKERAQLAPYACRVGSFHTRKRDRDASSRKRYGLVVSRRWGEETVGEGEDEDEEPHRDSPSPCSPAFNVRRWKTSDEQLFHSYRNSRSAFSDGPRVSHRDWDPSPRSSERHFPSFSRRNRYAPVDFVYRSVHFPGSEHHGSRRRHSLLGHDRLEKENGGGHRRRNSARGEVHHENGKNLLTEEEIGTAGDGESGDEGATKMTTTYSSLHGCKMKTCQTKYEEGDVDMQPPMCIRRAQTDQGLQNNRVKSEHRRHSTLSSTAYHEDAQKQKHRKSKRRQKHHHRKSTSTRSCPQDDERGGASTLTVNATSARAKYSGSCLIEEDLSFEKEMVATDAMDVEGGHKSDDGAALAFEVMRSRSTPSCIGHSKILKPNGSNTPPTSAALKDEVMGRKRSQNMRITHEQWMRRIQEEDDFHERRERVARGIRRCHAVVMLRMSCAFRRIAAFKRQSYNTDISAQLLESQARSTILLERKVTTSNSRRRCAYLLLCACERALGGHFATWHVNAGLVTVVMENDMEAKTSNRELSTDEKQQDDPCEAAGMYVGSGFDIKTWLESIVLSDAGEQDDDDEEENSKEGVECDSDEPLDNFLERAQKRQSLEPADDMSMVGGQKDKKVEKSIATSVQNLSPQKLIVLRERTEVAERRAEAIRKMKDDAAQGLKTMRPSPILA